MRLSKTWRAAVAGALITATLNPAPGSAGPSPLPEPAPVAPALRAILDAGAAHAPVIVRFRDDAALRATLGRVAGRHGVRYRSVPALAFDASRDEIIRLAADPGTVYVEPNEALPVNLTTATAASRAAAVWGSLDGGPISVGGDVIDGSGVGVAVVDTGVWGRHPDLAARMAGNVKVVSTRLATDFATIFTGEETDSSDVFVEMPHTDWTAGHGTHVAGIVAGDGTASGGRAKGAAPGASIYGFGAGEGLTVLSAFADAAFDWIVGNHDLVSPPIRVVNSSWGVAGAFDPESLTSVLTNMLVAEGVTVVWAAGNGDTAGNGGTCADDRTVGQAKNPIPGVISVGASSDADTGTRDGIMASSSSRGRRTDPSTWPDLAAPGENIYSALAPTGSLSWTFKSLDLALGALDALPGDNPFGTAINQHAGQIRFRFDTTGPAADLDWIIFSRPVAIYNAHTASFATGFPLPSVGQSQQVRFYAGVPSRIGNVHPRTGSSRTVRAGDAILLTHTSGTGNPISAQVTSPSGTTATIRVSFPCAGAACGASIDLAGRFAGEPSDGTWTVSPGPTVSPGDLSGDAFNPHYVNFSGTSMAAPHVAGVAALVLHANPALTPAEVEDVLEDTAYKFTAGEPYTADAANPGTTSSCDKGHGLVDAKAAVEEAIARLG